MRRLGRLYRRRVGRLLTVGLVTVVSVLVLAFGVFPTRTLLSQREALARTEERLEVLRDQNRRLEDRVELLQTDEEIERLAREQYNLVRPGEEVYAILPAPEDDGGEGADEGGEEGDDSTSGSDAAQSLLDELSRLF